MPSWRALEVHTYPAAALVKASALQAAGFLSFVDNYFHGAAMPNQVLALGGYRVVVLESDWEIAQGFVACADVEEPADLEPVDVCANCASTDVFRGASLILSALGYLVAAAPLPAQTSYRKCRRCGREWDKPPR